MIIVRNLIKYKSLYLQAALISNYILWPLKIFWKKTIARIINHHRKAEADKKKMCWRI